MRPWLIALLREALAFTFVRSTATWANCTKPAARHRRRACTNRSDKATRWRLRSSAIFRKSGRFSPVTAMSSTRLCPRQLHQRASSTTAVAATHATMQLSSSRDVPSCSSQRAVPSTSSMTAMAIARAAMIFIVTRPVSPPQPPSQRGPVPRPSLHRRARHPPLSRKRSPNAVIEGPDV